MCPTRSLLAAVHLSSSSSSLTFGNPTWPQNYNRAVASRSLSHLFPSHRVEQNRLINLVSSCKTSPFFPSPNGLDLRNADAIFAPVAALARQSPSPPHFSTRAPIEIDVNFRGLLSSLNDFCPVLRREQKSRRALSRR